MAKASKMFDKGDPRRPPGKVPSRPLPISPPEKFQEVKLQQELDTYGVPRTSMNQEIKREIKNRRPRRRPT